MWIIWVLLSTLCRWVSAEGVVASFPLQFSANIEITSHLIESTDPDDYPPKRRRMMVYYDYLAKKARVEIEAGYEAAKIYIRRYDLKNEYMIRLPPIDDCKRSHLGEVMPLPDISFAMFVAIETINSMECNHFLVEDDYVRIHIYMSLQNNAPVRLIEESIENEVSTPLLTYDYTDVVLSPPSAEWFELPEETKQNSCVRHLGGFPYLHIFHYYVRL